MCIYKHDLQLQASEWVILFDSATVRISGDREFQIATWQTENAPLPNLTAHICSTIAHNPSRSIKQASKQAASFNRELRNAEHTLKEHAKNRRLAYIQNSEHCSGAGTNLKVGGGHRSGAKVGGGTDPVLLPEIFLVVPLQFFGFKSTISRSGERFCDGQYSLVSFLFAVLLLTVPPCPPICKSGSTCPRAIWSRRLPLTMCQTHVPSIYL